MGNYTLSAEIAAEGMYAILTRYGVRYFMGPVVQPGSRLQTAAMTQTGVAGGQIIHFRDPLTDKDAGCVYLDNHGLLVSRPVPAVLLGGTWGIWDFNQTTAHAAPCP